MEYLKLNIILATALVLLINETASFSFRYLTNRKHLKLIESTVDLQADPCNNFYQYACGNWKMQRDSTMMYDELSYEVNHEMANYMDHLCLKGKPAFVEKAYTFYKSCLNMQQFDHYYYLEWLQLHENLKLPKLWIHRSNAQADWIQTLAILRRYGLNGIFIEEMMLHRRDNNSQTIIDLDKPMESGGFLDLTLDDMKALMNYLDFPDDTASFEKLWHEINQFERQLQELNAIEDEKNEPSLIRAKDLPLPWLSRYLALVLEQYNLDPEMELYIQNIPYMEALYELLKKHDNHFICKYLEIRFLWHLNLSKERRFNAIDCVDDTRRLLPLAMHWIYDAEHPELKDYTPIISNMFDSIVRHFKQTLRANNMNFNQTVLEFLISKLASIQLKVGNLPRIKTAQVLESYYEGLHFNVSNFYGNHLQVLNHAFKASHARNPHTLTNDIDHFFNLELYGEGNSYSLYFLPRQNIVMIPLSALRPPLYHPGFESIYKFSSLGSALAHEIFHGFDAIGLEVDYKGKMNSWQYNNVRHNSVFAKNYKCLQQHNSQVIHEKLADISGLRYAFGAFFDSTPNALTETRSLKGVDMSFKKLFFLNYAQIFCNPIFSDSKYGQVDDRVNDAVTHFEEFSKAYGCSRQSRMFRIEGCQVWR